MNFIIGVCNEFKDNWHCSIGIYFLSCWNLKNWLSQEAKIGSNDKFILEIWCTIHFPCNVYFVQFKFNLNTYLTCTCTEVIKLKIKKKSIKKH